MKGITAQEWSDLSEEGKVCGVFGCEADDLSKCSECNHHYCLAHKSMHLMTHLGDTRIE